MARNPNYTRNGREKIYRQIFKVYYSKLEMGLFGNNLNKTLQDINQKSAEQAVAYNMASNLMRMEFPEKFPKKKISEYAGTFNEDTAEIVGDLKIKEDETYYRNIEVNGKIRKYKIILRKGTVEAWEKKQKEAEEKKQLEKQLDERQDDKRFFQMLKWGGVILGIIILFYIIKAVIF